MFREAVRSWSRSIYNIQNVIVATEDRINHDKNNPDLLESLAELFALFFLSLETLDTLLINDLTLR